MPREDENLAPSYALLQNENVPAVAALDGAGHSAPPALPPRAAALPTARALPIALQRHVNVTLEQGFALSIILAYELTYPWYYENYVQLFSLHNFRKEVSGFYSPLAPEEADENAVQNIVLNFTAKPGHYWYQHVTLNKLLGHEPVDIIGFIIQSLNQNCYPRIEVDEFYLPNKRSFGKRNFAHPTLVYGYDNESATLSALGFDAKGLYSKLTYSYEDFSRAYTSAQQISVAHSISRSLVSLYKMRNVFRRFPFSLTRFLGQLQGYLSSTMDSAQKYDLTNFLPADAEARGMVKVGLAVYEHYALGLRHLIEGRRTMNYNSAHLLYEHKRALFDAFSFIVAEFRLHGPMVELVEEFQQLVQEFHSMRWKFLRFQFTSQLKLIEEVNTQLAATVERERALLLRIHEQLQAVGRDSAL